MEEDMSVTVLAASAVALLAPYVTKIGEGAAGELGKQALQKGEALLSALWARWNGNPGATSMLSKFIENPDAGRANLQSELAMDLNGDPKFRESLQALINGGSPEAFQSQVVRNARYVSGPEIVRLVKGRVTQMQDVQDADTVIGPKINTVGE
jgi:hypothetical protein